MNLGMPITRPLLLSAAVLVITAIVVLAKFGPLASAIVAPGEPQEDQTLKGIQERLAKYEAAHKLNTDRLLGRSLFYPPPRPAPRVDTTIVRQEPTRPPLPPPPPAEYKGPAVVSVVGEKVWFRDSSGKDSGTFGLKVGEERDGVKVLGIVPPWTIMLRWKDIDWPYEFFKTYKSAQELQDSSASSLLLINSRKIATPEAGDAPKPPESTEPAAESRAKAVPQPQIEPPPQADPKTEPTPEQTQPSASGASPAAAEPAAAAPSEPEKP